MFSTFLSFLFEHSPTYMNVFKKTYRNDQPTGGAKCSLANIWISLETRLTIQAGSKEDTSVESKDTKDEQKGQSNPSSFFHCIRSWKKSYSTKNIYAYKISSFVWLVS